MQDIDRIHGLGLSGKESACQCKRQSVNPWVRKIPWRRVWQPTLQCSCLENSMDRGAWWATVHGVSKSQTLLSMAWQWAWLIICKGFPLKGYGSFKQSSCVLKGHNWEESSVIIWWYSQGLLRYCSEMLDGV